MSIGTEMNGPAAAGPRAATGAALDIVLTDAAIEPGAATRLVRPGVALKLAGGVARHPNRAGRRVGAFGAELARIAAGGSPVAPPKGDRRFTDRAWQESWMFHRLMQAYLALEDTVDGLVEDAALDWRTDLRTRFMGDNLLDAIAPTNFPLTNPQVLKETIDRGGANLVKGGRRLTRDVSKRRRVAVIGHSRGGHYARAVAARRPELVSHSISMGADLQAMFHCSVPTLAAVEAARGALARAGRARWEECLTYRCRCTFTDEFFAPFPGNRVRMTSIYSKGAGVVRWQAQLVPFADCVEVSGSHVGLVFNRKSYRVIARALAAPELPGGEQPQ